MSLNGRVWSYDVEDDGTATVTDVSPATGAITIPTILGGCPVTGVGGWAFEGCGSLTSVTIGAGVTNIGWDAFYDCTGLKAVTFLGNAPTDEEVEIVTGDLPNGCTVYVPRGSTGWGVPIPGTWCGHPIRYSVGDVSTSPLTFAKTKVSVKESVAYVDVTVNRVDKDGRVRVKYATADDTAKAGEDYAETTGVLAWADGDKKAKKIRIPLVPDLVMAYDGVPSKSFTVRLEPLGADELDDGERLADVSGGDVFVVTVTETSKSDVTPESVYAKKAAKRATVKKDEDVPLSSGTFYGVVEEDGDRLTNGLSKLASITFTVSAAATPALSAKVAIGGKTYAFSAKDWDEAADGGDTPAVRTRTLVSVQKAGKIAYTNTLVVAVRDGATTDWNAAITDRGGVTADAWPEADATVELLMNVLDVKGKGFQTGIRYAGALYRQNAKIQAYLDVAYKFAGYYTVALVPDGGASGNGYLTLTVDNKGQAKVAGMLVDGTTKPSVAPKACAVVVDESSANGLALLVPVHFAKATTCFGGTLRLYAVEDDSNPDGSGIRIVVDSSNLLTWYDDSAFGCVALYGDGECITLAPCGGWYDKVVNLQRYYLDYALAVETADISAFPSEALPDEYDAWDASPSGFGLAFNGNKVTYDKKKLVKWNGLVDFDRSTNACNVSVKLARATGLVTGSFSLWAKDWDGVKQKEVTGFKTYGILLLARDPTAPLDERVIAPGFAAKKIKTTDHDDNARKKIIMRTFSVPFNIVNE